MSLEPHGGETVFLSLEPLWGEAVSSFNIRLLRSAGLLSQ